VIVAANELADNTGFGLAFCALLGMACGLGIGRLMDRGHDLTGALGLVGLIVGVVLYGVGVQ
jgi:hypothetical protein